jgi:two-component system nitrate/nitrite sensor histidine kinase NarX
MLAASNRTLSDAYLDARQAIDNLRRVPDMNLADLLRAAAEEFRAAANIAVHVAADAALKEVPPNVRAQMIRIVQEALANVRKHAQARAVNVSVYEQHGDLVLEVRDDGVGFAPETVASPSQHGLRGMRERAELIGAEFQVISRPGAGTSVRVQIPLAVGEEK